MIVVVTVLVRVSITDTMLLTVSPTGSPLLATQACEPSGDTATPAGKEPTGTVAVTLPIVGSMTETELPIRFAT